MLKFVIVAGVNGVGKSSLTAAIIGEQSVFKVIDVDKMAKKEDISNIEAGKRAIKEIEGYIEKGESFIQETTLSGRGIVNTIKKAKQRGYEIEVNYVGLDTVDDSLERIKNRVARGGHYIPESDVRRRFGKRFDVLREVYDLVDKIIFWDNGNGFEIVGNKNRELLVFNKVKWIDEFLGEENG